MPWDPSTRAKVTTPMDKNDLTKVITEEIPLPPAELWEALDNSSVKRPDVKQPDAKPEAAPIPVLTAKPPQAILNFLSPDIIRTIPLQYPFNYEGLGLVDKITVRRLTVGDLGQILDNRDPNGADNFDIYEAMTGIPAPVLRGLIDVDGEEVSQVCFDFLPRIFRPRTNEPSSTSPNGET